MSLNLKEHNACAGLADVLYDFLPGSGSKVWAGHITFGTVAGRVGVGDFWQGGSKQPAITTLLELTLDRRRGLFQNLIMAVVREGITYRQKKGDPIKRGEIERVNGLLLEVGYKLPDLWDETFLSSLDLGHVERAARNLDEAKRVQEFREQEGNRVAQSRTALGNRFFALPTLLPQAAGYEFEKILNELFTLCGLVPRCPFKVVGEQIDGSFDLDAEIYLVEAKWTGSRVREDVLMVFREKIAGKSQFTRGCFISLNNCTGEAREAITRGKQPNFFIVDGSDIVAVLENQIGLPSLLRWKLRFLAEEGNVFVDVNRALEREKAQKPKDTNV